jgi:hypothetical protein
MKLKNIFCLSLVLSGGLFGCSNVALSADEMTTNYPSASLTLTRTNANGMVTQKKMKLETTNVKEAFTYFATNYVNFVSSVTNEE